MRITTWNVNGLRAATKKGLFAYLEELDPTVLLLQEIRCLPEQLPKEWTEDTRWIKHWHPAEKKGYSGVATLSRRPSEHISIGFDGSDDTGRLLRTRVDDFEFINVYLPSGARGNRQAYKDDWLARFLPWAQALVKQPHPVVLVGDLNIAHLDIDVWNPKSASKMSGFLPHERSWFSEFLETGWTDCVRTTFGEEPGPYSWWSNFGKARVEDRGWRIDHILANPAAAKRLVKVSRHREAGITCSDHAPLTAEFK